MTTLTTGHKFGVLQYRKRKFGAARSSPAYWAAWEQFLSETVGRRCGVDDLSDDQARRLIDAMKALPDYGQLTMGLEI